MFFFLFFLVSDGLCMSRSETDIGTDICRITFFFFPIPIEPVCVQYLLMLSNFFSPILVTVIVRLAMACCLVTFPFTSLLPHMLDTHVSLSTGNPS